MLQLTRTLPPPPQSEIMKLAFSNWENIEDAIYHFNQIRGNICLPPYFSKKIFNI